MGLIVKTGGFLVHTRRHWVGHKSIINAEALDEVYPRLVSKQVHNTRIVILKTIKC